MFQEDTHDRTEQKIIIAVVQFKSAEISVHHEDIVNLNLQRMISFAEMASDAGASIVLFPELTICGYGIGEGIERVSEAAQGRSFQVCDMSDNWGSNI